MKIYEAYACTCVYNGRRPMLPAYPIGSGCRIIYDVRRSTIHEVNCGPYWLLHEGIDDTFEPVSRLTGWEEPHLFNAANIIINGGLSL